MCQIILYHGQLVLGHLPGGLVRTDNKASNVVQDFSEFDVVDIWRTHNPEMKRYAGGERVLINNVD